MKDVVEMLHASRTFFLATEGDGVPHVRPFGAVVRYDGRVWFCTNDKKAVAKQIKGNPNVEIAAMAAEPPQWIRITGKAVFEENQGAKDAMFAFMPQLKEMYANEMDHFKVFYLKDAAAKLCRIDGVLLEELSV